MDFGISTRCFGAHSLTPDLLERLRREDFRTIELHASLPGFDYHNRSAVRGIARWFPENEMPAPSLHLPFAEDPIAIRPVERQRALDEIKRCLELADLLPLRFVVLHLGTAGQDFNPVSSEHAYAAIAAIQSFAGVRVLLETLPNNIATFDRIREFKAAAQIPNLGICYDTGHGEMEGPADAIHLNDNLNRNLENEARTDDHLWPFEGTRNWYAFVEQLVLSSFDGPLILEGSDDRLDKAADSRSRLRDLLDEANDSMEEFRLRYHVPAPRRIEDDE